MKNFAALFPGQGSQSVGMGQAFFSSSELARDIFCRADKNLGFLLSDLCLNGPLDQLTLTQNAQPAILTTSYICYLLAERSPTAGAGHSLGEYTALVAAKSLNFDDAVSLVNKRGRYMQEAVPAGAGKMLAVMGATDEQIRSTIASLSDLIIEVANYNSPGQIVVAGSAAGIDAFTAAISSEGAKAIPLNVSAPFHCSLMRPAAESLERDLAAITFSDPIFPVYSNVTANVIVSGTQARELLRQQVTSSVRWTESIQNMISEQSINCAVEFGSGGVLTKLIKRIDSSIERYEISEPKSLETTCSALGS